ncbi:hypothetical protein BCR42DRAFT_416068 [Absidia repens]|uniref:Uncharacterized protein n=1 Tax=Absidia repens TaxID=90262 RepID=A0A1X2IGE2_9FUNG|nr:hypothetical protein BCR42DRAFT_416068 [Absidia repens]
MLYISTPPSSIHSPRNNKSTAPGTMVGASSANTNTNTNVMNRRGIQKAQWINKNLTRRDQLLKMAQYEYSRQLLQYTQAQLHRVPENQYCHTNETRSAPRSS